MHAIFEALYDRRFVAFLEWMTGIAGLEPDRELAGAGFHQGAAGSYLRVHADHNAHPLDPSRFRRVNVMVYLNKGWKSEWNGDLELWDRHAIAPRKRIAPAFNRALIMEVDDTAYHGYGPLRTPRGRIRKALAAYYYSKLPAPGQSHEPHPTSFPDLGGENPAQAFAERIRRGALARVEKALRVP
jgi:Rps23 Pro-64 3,4-dihydroxylase Tpa1-like proline 4-hydroxylase